MLGLGTNGTIRALVTARSPRGRNLHQPYAAALDRRALLSLGDPALAGQVVRRVNVDESALVPAAGRGVAGRRPGAARLLSRLAVFQERYWLGRSRRAPERKPVNRPSLVQPVDGRPVVSTGVGITLVVAGAIMHFAVTATSVHVAGVIVMLVGVFALLLSLLVWGPLARRLRRRHHSAIRAGGFRENQRVEFIPGQGVKGAAGRRGPGDLTGAAGPGPG
jgi:hypothetical protein